MNKKALALAVAAVVAAPAAFAQSSSVTLYGRAALAFDSYEAKGATAGSAFDLKRRYRVVDNASRLGVRGVEDLGGGLRAIFVIESGVNMDTGTTNGQSGAANASSAILASRDSFVGLEGTSWGRLTFGRQSVYWNTNQMVGHAAFGHITSDPPWQSGISGRANPRPVARQSNVLQYQTPVFGGVYGRFSYSPQSEAAQGGANVDSRVLGASVIGNWGPVGANFDWANNKDATGSPSAAVRGDTTHLKAAVGYRYMPGGEVGLVLARTATNIAVGVTSGDKVSQNGWMLKWSHLFGNVEPIVSVGQQMKISGCDIAAQCDDTKSTGMTFGARYLLSKRTWISANYSKISNQKANFADWVAGGITSTVPGTATIIGADPVQYGIQIYHDF